VTNALLGGLLTSLTWLLTRRLFGLGAAAAAALIVALDPHSIHFSASLYSETLYTVLLTAGLILALELGRTGAAWTAAATGASFGLAGLVRGTAFYFLPLLALALLWRRGRAAWRSVAGVVICACLVVTPWVVRNNLVHDAFVFLDTKAGWNLWLVTHPLRGRVEVLPQPPELRSLSEVERHRLLLWRALGFIGDDPARFIRRGLRHVVDLWSPLPSEQSGRLARVARPLFMIPLQLLGLAGLVIAWPRRRELGVLLLLLLHYSVVHFVMWGGPRFRLPVDPVLAAFAGLALAWLAARLTGRGDAPKAGAATLC
jgi:4-amino-4-deoxy-L-arabinose transferase-like glycosyltransferase